MEQQSPGPVGPGGGVLTALPPSVLRVASPRDHAQKGAGFGALGDRPATSQALCRPAPLSAWPGDKALQVSPGSPRSPSRPSSLQGPVSPSQQRPGSSPFTSSPPYGSPQRSTRAVSLTINGTSASPLSATSSATRPSTVSTDTPGGALEQRTSGVNTGTTKAEIPSTATAGSGNGEGLVSARVDKMLQGLQDGPDLSHTATSTRPGTAAASVGHGNHTEPSAVPDHVAAMQAAAGLRRPATVADTSASRLKRSIDAPFFSFGKDASSIGTGRFQRQSARPGSGGTREGVHGSEGSLASRGSTPASKAHSLSRPATTTSGLRTTSRAHATQALGLSKSQELPGMFQDLFEATNKSFAAAMGEWHLQPLDCCNAAFKQRVFQGAIGPEMLKCQYGLQEEDILRLYRVLYLYSVGFCAAVLEPTQRARGREQLLEAVFKAFSQLWDEALGISFQSEIVNVLHTKMDAVAAMEVMSTQMAAMQEEHTELQERLQQFVRRNIDNMLAYRMVKEKASTCEGEATMLSATNDALAVKLAGSQLAREELIQAARTAADKQAVAEEHAGVLEVTLARAKAALKEQQQLVARHVHQIKRLEETLEATNAGKDQLQTQYESNLVELDELKSRVDRLETEAQDKDKAYALLHSNWLVKDRDLTALRQINVSLESTVKDMKETHATARKQIKEAKDSEQAFKKKWELSCEQVVQVTETNKKLASRNAELIRSYWPLVSRLREAEEQHDAMKHISQAAVARQDSLANEVERLQRLVDVAETDAARLHAMEQELATDEFQVSEKEVDTLPPDVRRKVVGFFRSAKKRVAELTQQLVQLVDVQAASAYELQKSQASCKEQSMKVAILEQQLQDTTQSFTRKLARAAAKGLASGNTHQAGGGVDLSKTEHAQPAAPEDAATALELATLKVELQEAREALAAANARTSLVQSQVARLTSDIDSLKDGAASKDRWILEAASQANVFASKVDLLLLQDPACIKPPSLTAAAPQTGSAGAGADASPQSDVDAPAGQDGEGLSAGGPGADSTEAGTVDVKGSSDVLSKPSLIQGIATGRIASSLKSPGETRASLVTLDHSWEQLSTALDRLLEWSQEVMSKKALISQLSDFQQEAESAASRAQAAESQLASLQQQLQEAEEYRASMDKVVAETAASLQVAMQTATAATAAEATSAADAQACRQELGQLHEKHVLMEEEYWVVKSQLLEAQLAEAGLRAEHDQALENAARAEEARAQAEFEAAEQRGIRQQLESEIVGLKAWVRTMQRVETAYKELLMDHGRLKEELQSSRAAAAVLQEQVVSSVASTDSTERDAMRLEVERLQAISSQAAEQVRESQVAQMEMQALLAEARRAAEAASDALRFSQSELDRLMIRENKALTEAGQAKDRAEQLTKQLLNTQLLAKQQQEQKGLALGALIDARMQTSAVSMHLEQEPQPTPV